jgi:hypothetical protein
MIENSPEVKLPGIFSSAVYLAMQKIGNKAQKTSACL